MKKKYILFSLAIVLVGLGLWWLWGRSFSKNVYRNDKLGFELNLPKSWDNFKAREEVFNDQSGVVSLTFSLPLKGQSETEDVWFVNAWPVRRWNAFDCGPDAGVCYKGEEIARNSNYAFEKGYIMNDLGNKCSTDKDFYAKEMKFCNQMQDLNDYINNWKPENARAF